MLSPYTVTGKNPLGLIDHELAKTCHPADVRAPPRRFPKRWRRCILPSDALFGEGAAV